MAVKEAYHIPYSLAQSYSDSQIPLRSSDGSVGKVLPLGVVLSYVGSVLGCMFFVTKTFVGSMGSMPQIVIFVILWAALTVVLTMFDGTHRMNVQRIVTLLDYLPKRSRYVYTRKTSNAIPFSSIYGIDKIDEDGTIHFTDKTLGCMFRVVGSASVLLFEADRDAILNRVDAFYRKWTENAEIIYVTTKESQKVYRQLANMQKRYNNLRNDDLELQELCEEQFKILKEYVGSTFKSTHQYLIVKADNLETMRVALNILQNEVEESALMIKQCIPLEEGDVNELFASIYQGGSFGSKAKRRLLRSNDSGVNGNGAA